MTTEKNPFIRAAEASLSKDFTYLTEAKSTITANISVDTKSMSNHRYQEVMKTTYYIGIAHHSLIIADFNMLGDIPGGEDLGGYVCEINFSRIKQLLVSEEDVNRKQFSVLLNEFCIYNDNKSIKREYDMDNAEKKLFKKERSIPLLIYFETHLREKFIEQYGIAYTTSKMYYELKYIRPCIVYVYAEVKPNVVAEQLEVNKRDKSNTTENDNDLSTPKLSSEILSKPSGHLRKSSRYHRLKEYGLYTSSHFQSILKDEEFRNQSLYGWIDPTNNMLNSQRPFFTLTYSEPKSLIYESVSPEEAIKTYVQRITSGKEYRISKNIEKVQRVKQDHMKYLHEMYNVMNVDISDWDIFKTHVRILGYINTDTEDLPLAPISYVITKTSEFLNIQDRFRDVVVYFIRRRYVFF
jgi:hypothetical protein